MSYAESEARLLFFSSERRVLLDFNEDFRAELDKKGSEYTGPMTPPVAEPDELVHFLSYIQKGDNERTTDEDSPPGWLFDAVNSEENLEMLVTAAREKKSVCVRKYTITGSNAVEHALSFDKPDTVYASVTLGHREHRKGTGNSLYTWDPDMDNVPSHPDGSW